VQEVAVTWRDQLELGLKDVWLGVAFTVVARLPLKVKH
jgi:hypothetical protein